MNRYSKYPSKESGPFNTRGSEINFDVEENALVDMTKSYVLLHANITTSDADPKIIRKVSLQPVGTNVTNNGYYPNSALIEQVRVESQMHGVLEEINNDNILRSNLEVYIKNRYELQEDMLGKMTKSDRGDRLGSIFRELYYIGNTQSKNVVANIRVPLSSFCGVGELSEYPAHLEGKTRLRVQIDPTVVTPTAQIYYDGSHATRTLHFKDIAGGRADNNISTWKWAVSAGGALKKENRDQIPFFVGQILRIQGTEAGAGAKDKKAYVTNIAYNNVTRETTITTTAVDVGGTDAFTDISVTETNQILTAGTNVVVSLDIQQAELVLFTKPVPSDFKPNALVFDTFVSENFSIPAINEFHKQFQIEGDCKNLFMCRTTANNGLMSDRSNLTRYRLKLNDDDMTNRDVPVANNTTPLYTDRLNATIENMGYTLKSMDLRNDSTHSCVVATPVPLTESHKFVEFNLYGSASLASSGYLFKQIVKVFPY